MGSSKKRKNCSLFFLWSVVCASCPACGALSEHFCTGTCVAGDLLNKYLYLTGRVNMRSIEVTIQNLIGSGMNPKTENNPYLGFVYTSFQERATWISHGNTRRDAGMHGDKVRCLWCCEASSALPGNIRAANGRRASLYECLCHDANSIATLLKEKCPEICSPEICGCKAAGNVQVLKKICGMIAGDEARHERAYTKIIEELFRRDPDGAMLAFGDMMRKQIVMPAHLMDDLEHEGKNEGRNLFSDFSDVAQRLGIYTAEDYVSILEHLNMRWDVAGQTGLSGEAAKEQEFVLKLPDRIRKLSERALVRRQKLPKQDAKFSWIYDRPVPIA